MIRDIVNLKITQQQPISLVHFVTNRCNARCSFCFIDFDDPKTFLGELTLNEIELVTKKLGPMLRNVNLTGGEPFARKDFTDIADLYFQNTLIDSIFVTSNGSLPDRTQKFLENLTERHPRRQILFQFSIDAFPEEHNRIRKIDNLFELALESHALAGKFGKNVRSSISITISHENYKQAAELYDYLVDHRGVKAISLNIVRDEGVYKIPEKHKKEMIESYILVATKIKTDLNSGKIKGWDQNTLQGRLMNKKNQIINGIMPEIFIDPKYITPCKAGSLFGIIEANGEVKPCEILSTKIGNLRDNDYDFTKIWSSQKNKDCRQWIKDTKCNCHYDCAWSFNILASNKFMFPLASAALNIDN
jgi:radical SAM protein with 4Fe4S-binding SPASM domain